MFRLLKRIGILLAALVTFTLGAILLLDPAIRVEFTEDQIVSTIESRLPIRADHAGFDIEITDLVVRTRDDGKFDITADAKFAGWGLIGTVDARTTSSVTYSCAAFSLSDLGSDDIEVTLTDESVDALASYRRAAETFLSRKDKTTDEPPASPVEDEAAIRAAEEKVAASFREALDWTLRNVPIYRIDDSQPWTRLAVLSLAEIDVRKGVVAAVLEPSRIVVHGLLVGAVVLLALFSLLGGPLALIMQSIRRTRAD